VGVNPAETLEEEEGEDELETIGDGVTTTGGDGDGE